jgi:signal transduction histidine kinase
MIARFRPVLISPSLKSLDMNLICGRDAVGRERRRFALTDVTESQKAEETLKESKIRLCYPADQILNVQENEPKGLAWELHDELVHGFLALKLPMNSLEKKSCQGRKPQGRDAVSTW